MKKLIIVFVCLLACLILSAACMKQTEGDGQNPAVNSAVEVDIPDSADRTDEPDSAGIPPDDFTYHSKNPQDSGGITVTPKE